VLLGNGDGTFQANVVYDSGGTGGVAVAVADVNGDGRPDLLLANGTSNNVTVLLGNGDGTFQKAIAYSSGGQGPTSIAVADVNGDHKPDLLVANYCTPTCSGGLSTDGSVGVLLGNGDGTFQGAVSYDSGAQNTYSVAVANLTGNGKLDLAVVSCGPSATVPDCGEGDGVVSILLGNGDGTFQTAVPYDTGGAFSNSVAIADLNGDGELDLVIADACQGGHNCPNDGVAAVLLGNGDGTFQTAVTYDSGYETEDIGVGDINGDGKPDLIVASDAMTLSGGFVGWIGVLLGNGDGTFQPIAFFASGGEPLVSLAITDVNGDGKPDVLDVNLCPSSSQEFGCSPWQEAVGVLINTSVEGPMASISLTGLNFANQAAGVTSSSQAVTLTSVGTVNVTLNSVSITGTNSGDFAQTNNCGPSLAPGASCQIHVTFTPTGGPSRGATLQLNDNAPDSPQAIALAGTVQDFSLAVTSQASLTVSAGQVANYAIAISPVNAFAAKVALSCSGAPQLSTCTVNPSSVTVNGAGASANIVVTTTGLSSARDLPLGFPPISNNRFALCLLISGTLGLVLLASRIHRPRRGRILLFYGIATCCMLSVGITLTACGGSSAVKNIGSGTPTGTYKLAVTGTFTSGSTMLTNSTNISLVVQ
jgi:hypothetical protein